MSAERMLTHVLRVLGVVMLCALPAVAMPHAWMNAVHRWLGMGELPAEPIVGYLARTLSAMYALGGAMLLHLARDIRRHLALLRFLAGAAGVFAVAVFAIDHALGLPPRWRWTEGPAVAGIAIVLWGLAALAAREAAREPEGRREAGKDGV